MPHLSDGHVNLKKNLQNKMKKAERLGDTENKLKDWVKGLRRTTVTGNVVSNAVITPCGARWG